MDYLDVNPMETLHSCCFILMFHNFLVVLFNFLEAFGTNCLSIRKIGQIFKDLSKLYGTQADLKTN